VVQLASKLATFPLLMAIGSHARPFRTNSRWLPAARWEVGSPFRRGVWSVSLDATPTWSALCAVPSPPVSFSRAAPPFHAGVSLVGAPLRWCLPFFSTIKPVAPFLTFPSALLCSQDILGWALHIEASRVSERYLLGAFLTSPRHRISCYAQRWLRFSLRRIQLRIGTGCRACHATGRSRQSVGFF